MVLQAQDCTGMAMVFTLVSSALEWLNTRWEEKVKEEEEAKERRLREEEEAEHVCFFYLPAKISLALWKEKN